MAEYVSKVTIETPSHKMRDYDLSCQQVTTQTFMRPAIAYAKEFKASKDGGTKIKINLKTYSRMEPLLRPFLGSLQIRNRAFFVPFRQVWSSFDNMLTQSPVAVSSGGSTVLSGVPTMSYRDIMSVLEDVNNGFAVPGTQSEFDFFDHSEAPMLYTANGRQAFKLLVSLGYMLPQRFSSKYSWDTYLVSFLPLLCAAKVFIDWYYPAQYAHTGEYINIDGILQRTDQYQASLNDIWSCLSVLQWVFYDNDYFTSQWDTPVSPSVGTFTSITIPDVTNSEPGHFNQIVTNDASSVFSPTQPSFSPSNGTPFVGGDGNGSLIYRNASGVFTQFVDTALKQVTNYVKRHQLVGARVIDRMLADYQVVTDYQSLKRSYYIGSQVFPVQVSDVMSNSDTYDSQGDGSVLGQYAGKGIAFDGNGNFEFETKEFGMYLIFNTVVPDVAYYSQVDRQVLHKSRFDFYTPQFDNLGVMAISKAEVNMRDPVYNTDDPVAISKEIFGFLPQYSDYKCGFDRLNGNFIIHSRSQGYDEWNTMRSLGIFVSQYDGVLPSHSIEFMRGSDAAQYCRLFNGFKGEEFDVFFMVHRVNVKCSMDCLPMYDSYQFDEDEGERISMQANGAFLN